MNLPVAIPARIETGWAISAHDLSSPLPVEVDSIWRRAFELDRSANYLLDPDCARAQGNPGWLITGNGSRSDGSGEGDCVALIYPKKLVLRYLGFLKFQWEGARLAGAKLLGNPDRHLRNQMGDALAGWMREKQVPFLLFEDIQKETAEFDELQEMARRGFRQFESAPFQARLKIEFPQNPEDYWKKFSSKTRSTFRRKEKKLGVIRFRRFDKEEEVSEFLADAHRVSVLSWQTRRLGLRIRNDAKEILNNQQLARMRAFRSYVLYQEERPLAFLYGIQFRDTFHYIEVGYDPSVSNLSPGQVLLVHVLEDLIRDRTPQLFDFGAGDADYKRLFSNFETTSGSICLVSPTWSATLQFWKAQGLKSSDRTLRKILAWTGGLRSVRRFWRKGKKFPLEGTENKVDEPKSPGSEQ